MKQSESKYFTTASKMDDAFLKLLEKKDFEYITIKEICKVAGVNRSTFYLHYETIADLLFESVSYMNKQFLSHMKKNPEIFIAKLQESSPDELYLITPEYLIPYLDYIKQYRWLFRTVTKNATVLEMDKSYDKMFRYVLAPILDCYGVPQHERHYILAFYIQGIMAIISEWIKKDCADPIEYIADLIQRCVRRYKEEQ